MPEMTNMWLSVKDTPTPAFKRYLTFEKTTRLGFITYNTTGYNGKTDDRGWEEEAEGFRPETPRSRVKQCNVRTGTGSGPW